MSSRSGEVASKNLVVPESEQKCNVTVRRISVCSLLINDKVAVDVDEGRAQGKRSDFWPGVDGKTGHEVAAGMTIAAGKMRSAIRFVRIALAIEPVAGWIDDRILDQKRIAIVGERAGELELNARGGRLPIDNRIVGHNDLLNCNDTGSIAGKYEVARHGRRSRI